MSSRSLRKVAVCCLLWTLLVSAQVQAASSSTPVGADPSPRPYGLHDASLSASRAAPEWRSRGKRGAQVLLRSSQPDWVQRTRRIAVLVGIDAYVNGVRRLHNSVADARELARVLRESLGFTVTLLLDEDATRDRILQAINQLRDTTTNHDQLFFFFAGHGVSFDDEHGDHTYVLPQDAEGVDQNAASSSGISIRELRRNLMTLSPRHILMAFDSCFAGYAAEATSAPVGAKPAKRLAEGRLEEVLLSSYARQIMTAGIPGQDALEDDAWGHSAFTKALLDGLAGEADRNRDGIVPATELFSYVQEAVNSLTRGRQTPDYRKLTGDYGEFFFVLPGKGAARTRRPLRRAPVESAAEVATRGAPTKILIKLPRARVYASPEDPSGFGDLLFQDVVFLRGDQENGRAPIAFGRTADAAEGWIGLEAFEAWKTNEVYLVETQTAYALDLHDSRRCARLSTLLPVAPGCRTRVYDAVKLGLRELPLFIPVLEKVGESARVGLLVLPGPDPTIPGVRRSRPRFATGWLSAAISPLARQGERTLVTRHEAQRLANTLENLALAARRAGPRGGEELRIDLLRELSRLFGIPHATLLDGADSLGDLLGRGGGLPYASDLLDVSLQELAQWSEEDCRTFGAVLEERAELLRAFLSESRPGTNVGDAFHIFLPTDLVP